MVFKTSREVLLLPTMLGALNMLFGGGMLIYRGSIGRLGFDLDSIGAAVLLIMGTFFVQLAMKLGRYQIEVTPEWLGVGANAQTDVGRQMAWADITKLVKQENPGRGRKAPSIIYRVHADKRTLAFTSLVFKDHENLAALIAEHSGKTWEPGLAAAK